MSLKSYFFATTISLMLWVAVYFALVASYDVVRHASVIPGFVIRAAFATLTG